MHLYHPYYDKVYSVIGRKLGGKFLIFSTVKDYIGGTVSCPIYYNPTPDKEKGHDYYFGYNHARGHVFSAMSLIDETIACVLTNTEKVIYSASRHDCVEVDDCMIDGGRAYVRRGGGGRDIHMSLTENGPVFIDENGSYLDVVWDETGD